MQYNPSATSKTVVDEWNVTYVLPDNPPGEYVMQLTVYAKKLYLFPTVVASERIFFNITSTLNGNITNIQNNKTTQNGLAMTNVPVEHIVKLKNTDLNLLNSTATDVVTYWFVDCVYYGPTRNFSLVMNYTEPEKEHQIEALVIAGYEPITTSAPSTTPVPNTTTTEAPNSTTAAPSSTTAALSSTTTPSNSSTTIASTKDITKRGVETHGNGNSSIKIRVNGTLIPYDVEFPFVCANNTVPPDSSKTYGYFSSTLNIKGKQYLLFGLPSKAY